MWDAGKKVTKLYSINRNLFSLAMVFFAPFGREPPARGAHFHPTGQFSKRHPQLTDGPKAEKTPRIHFLLLLTPGKFHAVPSHRYGKSRTDQPFLGWIHIIERYGRVY